MNPVSRDAWSLTRAISPRPWVRVADSAAGGGVSGTYRSVRSTDEPTPPDGPWAVLLADPERRFRLVCLDLDAGGDAAVAQLVPHLRAASIPHLVTASGQPGHRHIWWAVQGRGLTDAEARDLAVACRGLVPSTDITPLANPATGCVRPPGSPHASGATSQILEGDLTALTDPRVTRAQVRALTVALAAAAGLDTQAPEPLAGRDTDRVIVKDPKGRPYLPGTRRRLPPSAAHALSRRIVGREDASPVQWTVLLGAVRAHWTFSDVQKILATAPGLEHCRTRPLAPGSRIRLPRPKAEQHRILATEWARAVAAAASHVTHLSAPQTAADDLTTRAQHVTTVVDTVLQRVTAAPGRWIRRSGASDLRVLKVLALITLDALALDIEADVRTIALRAGIGRQTVHDALTRLVDDGWITQTSPALGPHGARWSLLSPGTHTPPAVSEKSHHGVSTERHVPTWTQRFHRGVLSLPNPWLLRSDHQRRLRSWLSAAAHDVFTTRHPTQPTAGLGPHAGNVYADIYDAEVSMASPHYENPTQPLPQATGRVRERYVLRHVQRLLQLKLLRRTDLRRVGSRPVAVTTYRRDPRPRVALERGVDGVLQARATRYRTERLLWTWWCAELHWMTTPWPQRWARPIIGQTTLLPAMTSTSIWPAYPRTATRADHRRARQECDRADHTRTGRLTVATAPLPSAPLATQPTDYLR